MAADRVGITEVILEYTLEAADIDMAFVQLQKLLCSVAAEKGIRGQQLENINQIFTVGEG